MNKFLRITAVVAATIAFFSCNNGAYDARPDKNEGKNHLNPSSGVTVPLGTIKIVIENVSYLYKNGYYVDTNLDGRQPAFYCGTTFQEQHPNSPAVSMVFRHADGARPDATVKTSGEVLYTFIHPKLGKRIYYTSFDWSTRPDDPNFEIPTFAQIKGIDEGGNIYGTLSAGKYHVMPMELNEEGNGFVKPPIEDTVLNISGEFHLPLFVPPVTK